MWSLLRAVNKGGLGEGVLCLKKEQKLLCVRVFCFFFKSLEFHLSFYF